MAVSRILRRIPKCSRDSAVPKLRNGTQFVPLVSNRLRDESGGWDGDLPLEPAISLAAAHTAQIVSGNYFETLGAPLAAGRTFLPDEDQQPGAHPVVVISHGFWVRRFGADRGLVGKALTLNGQNFTVISR